MPVKNSIADAIAQEEQKIADSKAKIDKLKRKEAERFIRIANKVGFFSTQVNDDALARALEQAMASAGSPSQNVPAPIKPQIA